MRILYVEDNDDNIYVLRKRLTRVGYTVLVAMDGAQGVAAANAEMPDLIIMDMTLPVLDGWAATRQLKASPATRHIPVVALTAHAMSGDREKALEAGCDDFDTKPVEISRLLEKIQALLPAVGFTVKAEDYALLVVDDNEDNRYTLTRRLKREGYTNLATATGGGEALELLAEKTFDLILLDVMMPGLNGYEVLEHMRADNRLRHIPVIMVSALDEIESVIRCVDLGAEDYLSKPFNPTLLRARVGASLEKKRLRDELVAALDQIEGELRAARAVQLGMVPTDFRLPAEAGPLEIFATLEPARQIGGDLYDFFWGVDGRLHFVIADVSDKGAAAALFMARTKTMIRMVATLTHFEAGQPLDPDVIIKKVNEELCLDNQQGMFVTVFFGMVDPTTGQVSFCNAGHNAPYMVSAAGAVAALDGPRNKPLGIRPSFAYAAGTHQLDPGDCLFLFTDGITEAMDPAGDWFAEARLEETLRSLAGMSASTVVGKVVASVREFAATAPQADDIAAMAIRRRLGMVGITIVNQLSELPRVASLLDRLGADHDLTPEVVADMQVALDEVLSNITKYAHTDSAEYPIDICLQVRENVLEASIEDGGASFNPLAIQAPDLSAPIQQRQVGGIGMHFVKNLLDEVSYQRVGDRNRLVLRKNSNK